MDPHVSQRWSVAVWGPERWVLVTSREVEFMVEDENDLV